MKLLDQYDWIVLGDHPAALLSASLVAKLGLSVLVLPLAPSQGLKVTSRGQVFDPESNLIVGVGEYKGVSGIVSRVLNSVGARLTRSGGVDSSDRLIEPISPQILTPHYRVLLSTHEAKLQSEVQRELGVSKNVIERLGTKTSFEKDCLEHWQELVGGILLGHSSPVTSEDKGRKKRSFLCVHDKLIKKGFTDLTDLRGELELAQWVLSASEHGVPSHVYELLLGVGSWMGVQGSGSLKAIEFLRLWSLSRVSGSFVGGMSEYRVFLRDVAQKLGAHVPTGVEIKRLFVESGRFAGVQLDNWGSMISTHGGILGCRVEQVQPFITYTGRNWLKRKKNPPKPTGWKMTLALTVNEEAIPNGMSSRTIWQEPQAPCLEIELARPSDYSRHGEVNLTPCRVIYLRCVLPLTPETLTPAYQSMIASRMMNQAVQVMPFLEYHVIQIYPDYRSSEKPSALFRTSKSSELGAHLHDSHFSEVYGFESAQDISANLLVYGTDSVGLGSTTGIHSLYAASEQSYPELGYFGPQMAGLEAVSSFFQNRIEAYGGA